MYMIVSTLCALAIFSQIDAACKYPVKPCKRTDPNFSKCWSGGFLPVAKLAVKKLGMTSIDPWKSPATIITRKDDYHLEETNFVYVGTSNYKFLRNNINIEKNHISLKIHFPSLELSCTTMGSGKLLGYELTGPSEDSVNANVTCSFELKGHRKMKKGREYVIFDDNNVKCKGHYSNIAFKNVVKGTQKDNDKFAKEMEKRPDIMVTHIDMCLDRTIGSEIAYLIAFVYGMYPLDVMHPK